MVLFLLFNAVLNFTFASGFAPAFAVEPDWSSSAKIAPSGRSNPYQWDEATLEQKIQKGRLHALTYPVQPTGILLPARPVMKMLSLEPGDPMFGLLKTVLSLDHEFRNFKGFWKWLGLHDYPTDGSLPYPNGVRPDYPMGVSVIRRATIHGTVDGFTLSCAACHSATLFGKPILGMTNRFARANEMFAFGQRGLAKASPTIFGMISGANREERDLYREAREHIVSIGVKKPEALGLDTSLAQVALSLAKRKLSPYSERTEYDATHPRENLLDHLVADSKPAVWWNVKYKTRWLSDGSVISGNPVFTNFLWNEIGRGVDLPELIEWLQANQSTVEELTTAVFATTAPRYQDFFGEQSIHVERAKRGETLFVQNCAQCHGTYQKDWSRSSNTLTVKYFASTPIVDVGTDAGRRQGMRALQEGLNPLEFSQKFNIVIAEQKGYAPPPLEGIWARYPYLHNNSIPNLCALMTAPEKRPVTYFAGEAIDREKDYDQDCVGYPTDKKTPAAWKKDAEYLFDTRKSGLSNSGHYERIFTNADHSEKFNADQKQDLREFLKML